MKCVPPFDFSQCWGSRCLGLQHRQGCWLLDFRLMVLLFGLQATAGQLTPGSVGATKVRRSARSKEGVPAMAVTSARPASCQVKQNREEGATDVRPVDVGVGDGYFGEQHLFVGGMGRRVDVDCHAVSYSMLFSGLSGNRRACVRAKLPSGLRVGVQACRPTCRQ